MTQLTSLLVLLAAGGHNGIVGAMAQAVTKPANFVPQVKWQIDIMNTLDITKPLVPTDALVWDLDLYHLQRHPEIVDFLRVPLPSSLFPISLVHTDTAVAPSPQRQHCLLLQRRPGPAERLRLGLDLADPAIPRPARQELRPALRRREVDQHQEPDRHRPHQAPCRARPRPRLRRRRPGQH